MDAKRRLYCDPAREAVLGYRLDMDLGQSTPTVVRRALHDVRYARPLSRSPLVRLDAITGELRRRGMPDSLRSREWLLGQFLDELARQALADARSRTGARSEPEGTTNPAPGAVLALLRADFGPGNDVLEAWSALCTTTSWCSCLSPWRRSAKRWASAAVPSCAG